MESLARYLSSEVWQLIFSCLGDGDLKAVSLVCKDFLEYSNPLKESLKVINPKTSMLSRHINRFNGLKAIDLFEFKGDIGEAIREIGRLSRSLEALDIPIDHLCEESLESLSLRGFGPNLICPNLKALNCIIKSHLDCSGLMMIANAFPNLEQLRVENKGFYSSRETPLGFGVEYLASKLKLLKKIHLSKCDISDESLHALSLNCVLLEDVTIELRGGNGLTETGVAYLLRNSPNLDALSIKYPRSFRNSFSYTHAKALTSLVLGGISYTDEVLMAIAKAKLRLNNLGLESCNGLTASGLLMVLSDHLTKLSIERASITDEDMEVVVSNGDVGKLTHIEINKCEVTESTLFLLSIKCSSLVEIKMKLDRHGLITNVPLYKNHNTHSVWLSAKAE